MRAAPTQFTNPGCPGFEAEPGVFDTTRCAVATQYLDSFQDFMTCAALFPPCPFLKFHYHYICVFVMFHLLATLACRLGCTSAQALLQALFAMK